MLRGFLNAFMDVSAYRHDSLLRGIICKFNICESLICNATQGLGRPFSKPIDGTARNKTRKVAEAGADSLSRR